MSRRDFLKRSAGTAVAFPTMAALLDACHNPNQATTGGGQVVGTGGIAIPGSPYPLARQNAPVKWTIFSDNQPIPEGLQPEKNATLQIYNWDNYLYKKVIQEFCAKYNCNYQLTTFNNEDEALAKLRTGQLKFDVYFPTVDRLGKLVTAKLLQPLNQTYIPNLAKNAWPVYQNPFYDQEWRYTVPYVMWTTGIAYRRDRVPDKTISGMSNPYDILWNPKYKGQVGIYDEYRTAIGMVLLRNGITDLNTGNPKYLIMAQNQLVGMTNAVSVRDDINGAYKLLPEGQYTLHQAWSGDIVAGWFYTPQQNLQAWQTLGYWFPKDRKGNVDNDIIAIPSNAQHPVLAHLFLNWMLDFKHAMDNFSWVGYQPPQNDADPNTLTTTKSQYGKPYVWPWLEAAVVRAGDFNVGYHGLELTPAVDQLWYKAWQTFKIGAG